MIDNLHIFPKFFHWCCFHHGGWKQWWGTRGSIRGTAFLSAPLNPYSHISGALFIKLEVNLQIQNFLLKLVSKNWRKVCEKNTGRKWDIQKTKQTETTLTIHSVSDTHTTQWCYLISIWNHVYPDASSLCAFKSTLVSKFSSILIQFQKSQASQIEVASEDN